MKRKLVSLVTSTVLLLLFTGPALAQRQQNTGSITLYVLDELGKRLTIPPQVRVTPVSSGMPMPYAPLFTGDGGIIFSHLAAGEDYELVIKADGYQLATETISIPVADRGEPVSVTEHVYLKPLNQGSSLSSSRGQFVLAPRAEKEVQQGLKDLRAEKFESAKKHLEKALQMAPGNPYVNYVAGMIYVLSKHVAQAQPYLERSVSID